MTEDDIREAVRVNVAMHKMTAAQWGTAIPDYFAPEDEREGR